MVSKSAGAQEEVVKFWYRLIYSFNAIYLPEACSRLGMLYVLMRKAGMAPAGLGAFILARQRKHKSDHFR